jgi:hypothetical protein
MNKSYGIFNAIQFPELTIPGIMMGDGTVGMATSDLNADGYSGVFFFSAPYNKVVGAKVREEEFIGKPVDHTPSEFCIMFDNPASIDVLMGMLTDCRKYLGKEEYNYKVAAIELWKLLDNIDTLDDAIKEDGVKFRDAVRRIQRKRMKVFTSDGYNLFLTDGEQITE